MQCVCSSKRLFSGVTITEVVIAIAIASLTLSSTLAGYFICSRRAEWSAHSLAAQALAIQRLEQVRAAKWEPNAYLSPDEVRQGNFPPQPAILDVRTRGGNILWATNYTTISFVATNPPLRMIRVDCVWPFVDLRYHTNTLVTYRSADQ